MYLAPGIFIQDTEGDLAVPSKQYTRFLGSLNLLTVGERMIIHITLRARRYHKSALNSGEQRWCWLLLSAAWPLQLLRRTQVEPHCNSIARIKSSGWFPRKYVQQVRGNLCLVQLDETALSIEWRIPPNSKIRTPNFQAVPASWIYKHWLNSN